MELASSRLWDLSPHRSLTDCSPSPNQQMTGLSPEDEFLLRRRRALTTTLPYNPVTSLYDAHPFPFTSGPGAGSGLVGAELGADGGSGAVTAFKGDESGYAQDGKPKWEPRGRPPGGAPFNYPKPAPYGEPRPYGMNPLLNMSDIPEEVQRLVRRLPPPTKEKGRFSKIKNLLDRLIKLPYNFELSHVELSAQKRRRIA